MKNVVYGEQNTSERKERDKVTSEQQLNKNM